MTVFNMHEAKTQLSKLVDAAERGETVIIARDGKPAARLEAIAPAPGWSPAAMAFFAATPDPQLSDFEIPQGDLLPLTERELF